MCYLRSLQGHRIEDGRSSASFGRGAKCKREVLLQSLPASTPWSDCPTFNSQHFLVNRHSPGLALSTGFPLLPLRAGQLVGPASHLIIAARIPSSRHRQFAPPGFWIASISLSLCRRILALASLPHFSPSRSSHSRFT